MIALIRFLFDRTNYADHGWRQRPKRQRAAEPRWTADDERALADARASHGRVRSLEQRKRDAVHAELAREVWGGRGWRHGSMAR